MDATLDAGSDSSVLCVNSSSKLTSSPFLLFPPFEMDLLFSPDSTLENTSTSSPTKTPLRDQPAPHQELAAVSGLSSGSVQPFSTEATSNKLSEDMQSLKDIHNSPFLVHSFDPTSFTLRDDCTSSTRLPTPWTRPEMYTSDRQQNVELDFTHQFTTSTAFRRPPTFSQQRFPSAPVVPTMSKCAMSHTQGSTVFPVGAGNSAEESAPLGLTSFDGLRTCSVSSSATSRSPSASHIPPNDMRNLERNLYNSAHTRPEPGAGVHGNPSIDETDRIDPDGVAQSSLTRSMLPHAFAGSLPQYNETTETEWICAAEGCKAFNFSRNTNCIACGMGKLLCGSPVLSGTRSNSSTPPRSASSNCTTFSFRSSHSSCPSYDNPSSNLAVKPTTGMPLPIKVHPTSPSRISVFPHFSQAPASSSSEFITPNRPYPNTALGDLTSSTIYATSKPTCQVQQIPIAPAFRLSATGGLVHRENYGSSFATASATAAQPLTSNYASAYPNRLLTSCSSAPSPPSPVQPFAPLPRPSFTFDSGLQPQRAPSLVHPTLARSTIPLGTSTNSVQSSSTNNALQALLTPSGNALAIGGRIQNISGDLINPILMFWPDNEPLPNKGQLRPPNPCYAKVEGCSKPESALVGVATPPPIMNTGNQGPMARQALDWECLVCGYVNWRRRKVCQMCFPYAPGNEAPASHSNRMNVITALLSVANAQQQRVNAQVQALGPSLQQASISPAPAAPYHPQIQSSQNATSGKVPLATFGSNYSHSSGASSNPTDWKPNMNPGRGGGHRFPEAPRLSRYNLQQASLDPLNSAAIPSLERISRGHIHSPSSSPSTFSSSAKSNSTASISGASWLSSSPLWSSPDTGLSSSPVGLGWPQNSLPSHDMFSLSTSRSAPLSGATSLLAYPEQKQLIGHNAALESMENKMVSGPGVIGSNPQQPRPQPQGLRTNHLGPMTQRKASTSLYDTISFKSHAPSFQDGLHGLDRFNLLSSQSDWSTPMAAFAEPTPIRPTSQATTSFLAAPISTLPSHGLWS